MVWAFEEEPEVTLKLAVVSGEDDVDVIAPPLGLDELHDTANGFVDEFDFHGIEGVHLANLIGG